MNSGTTTVRLNTPIHVGDIGSLVASKVAAGRPKDRLFLELHKETIETLLRQEGK